MIATMVEPGAGVLRGDGIEGSDDGLLQVLLGPGRSGAQISLDLGEGEFDRIEVRGVLRQHHQGTLGRFDARPHPVAEMTAEIVEKDNLPWPQDWTEELLDIGSESD